MKDDNVKTRLTFENYENRFVWESPYNDVTMDDILNAFYGMMVSATWQTETVISAMKDFVEDHSYILEDEDGIEDEDPPFRIDPDYHPDLNIAEDEEHNDEKYKSGNYDPHYYA